MLNKKRKIVIMTVVILMVVLLFVLLYIEVGNNPNFYTEEEHLQNVKELMNKRMEQLNISNYEIFPIYKSNEELFGFVIDYENGHIYVEVHNPHFLKKLIGVSMYAYDGRGWHRFVNYEISNDVEWQKPQNISLLNDYPNRFWEIDKKGQPITYQNSHFNVSNMANERKYLLEVVQDGQLTYIPAVKHGDKYLNLISMDMFIYNDIESINIQSTCYLSFVAKASSTNF